MMDALNLAGPVSLELIHLDDPRERAYWAHVLSISEDELERIVDRVGSRAIDVRRHLARARHAEWQSRLTHRSEHCFAPGARASAGRPVFGLIVCGVAAVLALFGALAYGLMRADATDAVHACRRDHSEWFTIWDNCPKSGRPADVAESEP